MKHMMTGETKPHQKFFLSYLSHLSPQGAGLVSLVDFRALFFYLSTYRLQDVPGLSTFLGSISISSLIIIPHGCGNAPAAV